MAETTLVDRASLCLAADLVAARRLPDTGPAPSSLLGLGANSRAIIRPTSLVSAVRSAFATEQHHALARFLVCADGSGQPLSHLAKHDFLTIAACGATLLRPALPKK